jgi:hypothetical protein
MHMPNPRNRLVRIGVSIGIVVLLCVSALSATAIGPVGASAAGAPREAGLALRCGVTCAPPSSKGPGAVAHDLTLFSTQVEVLAGLPFNVTVVPPSGVNLTTVNWEFGDGTSLSGQTSLNTTHVYEQPGLDFVYASATDTSSTTHDNFDSLLPVEVLSSHVGDSYGLVPDLYGYVAANSSLQPDPTVFVAPGGSVSVAVVATSLARNVQTVVVGSGFGGPTPTSPDASLSGEILAPNGTSQVEVQFTGAQPPGLATLTYWEETSLAYNGSRIHQWTNFTFSIPVGMSGSPPPRENSPDPGSLSVYTDALPYTFDPGLDYDTAGINLFQNVYQTLLAVNGTQTGPDPSDFIPEIATCVPGSSLCTSLYGSSLISGNDYTFVISSAPQFYDPTTAASWGIYPSDVLFSIARTLAFSTQPGVEYNNGWMLAQTLLSSGSGSWDGGIHGAFNNTPSNIFASMTVNGTGCPSTATTSEHGCVTFDAGANGEAWPEFLAALANPLGGSIVPCGWFSAPAQGAGIPYWSAGNVTGSGDGPCPLPGTGTFGSSVSSMPDTGWDVYESIGSNAPGIGTVGSSMAGSGPYYLSSNTPGLSYLLQANPAYTANPDCTFSGCQPASGSYIPSVTVFVPNTLADGEQAIANGTADFALLPQNGTSTLPELLGAGVAGMLSTPVLSEDFIPFNLEYSPSTANSTAGMNFTAPSSLMVDPNLRQFLIDAFPYAQIQSTINTAQGIQYRFPYGGMIPTFVDSTTPTNVSWPWGNPDPNPADVGSAGYWWSLTASDSYAGAECSALSPCTFPVPFAVGDTTTQAVLDAWNASVRSLSGGAIAPIILPVSFFTLAISTLYSGAGGNPFPIYPFGWDADYADASDFVSQTYVPNATYTEGDAVEQELALSAFTSTSCPTSLTAFSSLTTPLAIDCQGPAYADLTAALSEAANMSNGAARILLYDEIEQVAERLALYASNGQFNTVNAFAPWIDPLSVVVNPVQGTIPWYDVRDLPGLATPLALRGPYASANPSPAEAPLELSSIATGGSSAYVYTWSNLPPGCYSVSTASLECTPTTQGSYTVTLHVSDSAGSTVLGTLGLVIGTPSPLRLAAFNADPSSVTVGSTSVLSVTTVGGFAPLSWVYTGLPKGCVTSDLPSISCVPTATGAFQINVSVRDSEGNTVVANTTLTVTAAPIFSASLAVAPSVTVDVAVPVTLTIQGENGVLPITVSFFAPGDCARTFTWTTTRSTTITCTAPSTSGRYSLNITLTDALGRTAYSNGSLTVNAAPSVRSFGPGTVFDVGESANLTLAYSGGTAPLTIAYTSLPTGCVGGNVSVVPCTFTTAGSYSVGVTITDSFGLFATAVTKISVSATLTLSAFTATPASLSVGQELNFTATTHGGSAPVSYVYSNLPDGCTTANVAVLACQPTAVGPFTVGVVVHDAAGLSQSGSATVTVTAAYVAPPPTQGFLSNTTLVEEVLAGGVVLAVVATIAYVVVRRRGRPPAEDPAAPSAAPPPEETLDGETPT